MRHQQFEQHLKDLITLEETEAPVLSAFVDFRVPGARKRLRRLATEAQRVVHPSQRTAFEHAWSAIEDGFPLIEMLFESVSAFGTVGFSAGITPDLSLAAKLLLVAAMFVGRIVPPMVLRVALLPHTEGRPFRYPSDNVLIG